MNKEIALMILKEVQENPNHGHHPSIILMAIKLLANSWMIVGN